MQGWFYLSIINHEFNGNSTWVRGNLPAPGIPLSQKIGTEHWLGSNHCIIFGSLKIQWPVSGMPSLLLTKLSWSWPESAAASQLTTVRTFMPSCSRLKESKEAWARFLASRDSWIHCRLAVLESSMCCKLAALSMSSRWRIILFNIGFVLSWKSCQVALNIFFQAESSQYYTFDFGPW